MVRRTPTLVVLAALITSLIVYNLRKGTAGPPQQGKGRKSFLPDHILGSYGGINQWRASDGSLAEPMLVSKSPYPLGKVKAPGSNYTKCLVMPRMEKEDTQWVQQELGDLIDTGLLTTAIYRPDDVSAPLRLVRNKGHEVMTFLQYMIDFYDKFADVNIFMHSHEVAWHNNELLDSNAALMVRHLSAERVTREGYMNMRCHWTPGCPDWLQPSTQRQSFEKPEEYLLAQLWTEMFPGTMLPERIAQPCCAQFAVSRERLRAIPRTTFEHLREWLLATTLSDYVAGRLFEYTWQYILGGTAVHCPSMSACYCDGFGVCFGDYKKFDAYFELQFKRTGLAAQLREWRAKADAIEAARRHRADGLLDWDESQLEKPEPGLDVELERKIAAADETLRRQLEAAMELGRDPRQRALESGRDWVEGDGF